MSRIRRSASTPLSARLPLALALLAVAGWALAQAVAPGFVASPDIYKVIAENAKYRVIEVVWKPGQKDLPHSHPDSAVYYLTDCSMRNQMPGLPATEGQPRAGTARVQGPIASHTIENIGSSDCRLLMFEPK